MKFVKLILVSLLFWIINICYYSDNLYSQTFNNTIDTSSQMTIVNSPWTLGISAGFLYLYHDVNFHGLPEIPSCCPHYTEGYKYGPIVQLIANYKTPKIKNFSFELRFIYHNQGGNFSADEHQAMYYSPDSSVDGLIKHTINTSLQTIYLSPQIKFNLFDKLNFHVGISLGKILQSYFEQSEELLKPEDLVFENNKRTRMQYSGNVIGLNKMLINGNFGISYDLFKNKKSNWYIAPELFLTYGFNNIINVDKWKAYSANLSIALYYNKHTIEKEKEEYKRIKHYDSLQLAKNTVFNKHSHIDTIKIEKIELVKEEKITGIPAISYDTLIKDNKRIITENYERTDTLLIPKPYELNVELKTAALDKDNEAIREPVFQIEEYLSSQLHPLLHYVFFDENSAEIPSRYFRFDNYKQAKNFNLDNLFGLNSLQIYYHILDIVGDRLNNEPNSKLTLVGCNADIREEKGNLTLSKQRAESIYNYLVNTWQIDPNRITIKTRNLPEKPSNISLEKGIAENRRVEIYINNKYVIPPFTVNDTLIKLKTLYSNIDTMKSPSFTGFRFYPKVFPKIKTKNWKINLIQNNDTTMLLSGNGHVPEYTTYYIKTEDAKLNIVKKPIKFELIVTDVRGKTAKDLDNLKIIKKTVQMKQENSEGDKKIDNYTLILFDYNSSKLSNANRNIPRLIRRFVKNNSIVSITGYSDKIGDEDYNLNLSRNRAKTAAKALHAHHTTYKGVGESIQLYSNEFPEARFYCRTVNIIVETPIKWK